MAFPPLLFSQAEARWPGEIATFRDIHRRIGRAEEYSALRASQPGGYVTYCEFTKYDHHGELGLTGSRETDRSLLVCCGAKVLIVDVSEAPTDSGDGPFPLAGQISDFTNHVLCCRIRSDGKLLVTGDGDGAVKLFQMANRRGLRVYRDFHERQKVRGIDFTAHRTFALSAGDDLRANVFEISADVPLVTFQGIHSDSVTFLRASPNEPDNFMTGSVDGTVKFWDIRDPKNCTIHLDHQEIGGSAGVASANYAEDGNLLVCAAGNNVCVWDIRKPSKPLRTWAQHMGTITSLSVLPSEKISLLTGSTDQTVKVTDLELATDDCVVRNSLHAEEPITTVATDSKNRYLVAGTETGRLLYWKNGRRLAERADDPDDDEAFLAREAQRRDAIGPPGSSRFFRRGRQAKPSKEDEMLELSPQGGGFGKHLPAKVEKMVRGFEYQKAVMEAVRLGSLEAFHALVEELAARGALDIAMRGKDADECEELLRFFAKQMLNMKPHLSQSIYLSFQKLIEHNGQWLTDNGDERALLALQRASQALEVELSRHGPLLEMEALLTDIRLR